jgi:hypothetical protein
MPACLTAEFLQAQHCPACLIPCSHCRSLSSLSSASAPAPLSSANVNFGLAGRASRERGTPASRLARVDYVSERIPNRTGYQQREQRLFRGLATDIIDGLRARLRPGARCR